MELTGNVQGLIDLVGGGSTVEVSPILESGEKIAMISVDDVNYDIYAPEGTEVDVTQIVQSGTKIATISVDGDDTDIYAPEGSVVDVTQVVESGTKIATISVDGVDTDIYAPASGEIISTSEIKIGTWIDGRDIYRQLITLPATWEITSSANYDIRSISSSYYKVIVAHRGYTSGWDDISNMFIVERSTSQYLRLMCPISISRAKTLSYLLIDYVKDDLPT